MSILLIDNYDSFTYNLFQLVQSLTEEQVTVYRNDALSFEDIVRFQPTQIILSPGPGHPKNATDFGVCQAIIEQHEAHQAPVLGVCLGHQGIVHYLGGTISQAPEIVHGKTSMVRYTPDSKLLQGLPNPFKAMRYHSLMAAQADLPPQIAVTARDTIQDLIMAIEVPQKRLYGVQFHPESIGTPEGAQMIRNFLTQC